MSPNRINKKESSYPHDSKMNDDCIKILEKKVKVAAQVTVKPHVHLLEPDVDCYECAEVTIVNKENSCKKNRKKNDNYKFIVEQELCLRIPLLFNAEVDVEKQGVICNIKPTPSSESSSSSKFSLCYEASLHDEPSSSYESGPSCKPTYLKSREYHAHNGLSSRYKRQKKYLEKRRRKTRTFSCLYTSNKEIK